MPQKPPPRKGPPVPSGSNSALSSLVSAAPFIPTTSSDTSTPAGASVASANEAGGYSVGAAPFVPEGKKVSLRADSVNAVPFVPTEGSTAQQGRAQEPNTSELRHTAVPREHLFRPGGDVAVRSQVYMSSVQQNPMAYLPGAHPRRAGGRGRAPSLPFGVVGEEESFGSGGRGRGRGGAGKGRQGGGQYQHHQHHQQSDLGPSPRTADFFMGKGRVQAAVQFMAEQTRSELQQQSFLIHAQGEPALPDMIGDFHSLYPLENLSHAEEQASSALGVRTQALKGLTTVDGSPYVLRRIDGKQVVARGELLSSARSAVEQWSQLADHPGIVGLRSVMVSDELGGVSSLFFIYDYHPGSLTLEASHLRPSHTLQGLVHAPIREEVMWSYLVQLTATLMAVHSADLHLRPPCLAPSKVLLAPNGHLRVNCCGITEALRPDASSRHDSLHQRQREDLKALGSLMLSLACAKSGSMPSLEYCVMHNSADFVKVVQALLAAPGGTGFTSWRQLSAVLHERTLMEMQAMHLRSDSLYNQLGKEYENGRLLRLLLKLGFINERPEFSMDPQWSETGDRYLLKLFRDFVFHSVQDDGSPVLDYGHVIECLNKLDAGIPEKILLLSRDEASMLVVSYADVKKCLETAFQELRTAASAASSSAAAHAGMANRYAGWTAGHH